LIKGEHGMRRAERLLQIIQVLRRHRRPVTAATIAAELEVSERTIYRDIVALQADRVPVRGEAGIGYVLDDGFDLPPLMFDADESRCRAATAIEAVTVLRQLVHTAIVVGRVRRR
jgi:predicted DNA-binding transcriptional regulator YafY